jgi:hypothetical protein
MGLQSEILAKAAERNSQYVDFLMEYPKHATNQLVLDGFENIYLGNTPGIELPNGNSFYLCRTSTDSFKQIFSSEEFSGTLVSTDWESLWRQDYLHRNFIFDGEGTFDGNYWRKKLVEAQTGVLVKRVYPPCIFMGDPVPLILDIETQSHEDAKAFAKKEAELISVNSELIELVKKDGSKIHSLTPTQFEHLVASILKNQGFQVHLTKRTRDGGYDILCTSKTISGEEVKIIVECKKYDPRRPVGIDIARSVLFVKEKRNASQAMIVTTSYFTKGVKALKSSQYDLVLVDYNIISEWINASL